MTQYIQEGAVYRFDNSLVPDDWDDVTALYAVESVNDGGSDPDCHTIELMNLETGEWSSVYRDNFGSGYIFVADSRDDLPGGATTVDDVREAEQ